MTKTYSQKLRDPRWQKKRLEILSRDNFTCQLCNSKETELHVHHEFYIKGANPWEYEDSWLITYCKYCHILYEFFNKEAIGILEIKHMKNYYLINAFYYTSDFECESELHIYQLNNKKEQLEYLYSAKQKDVNLFNILNLVS